jgi:GTP pyrophosphokinase
MAAIDQVALRTTTVPPDGARGPDLLEPACALLAARHPDADLEVVRQAYQAAEVAHQGQWRASGDPFITHPVAVATVVAELGLDAQAVAAGLLHDAVEDGGISLEEVTTRFGPVVAAIVDGVTKLDRLAFDSEEAQQAATVRKMLLAMAKDWRVLVIKLADRLHNMRTLDALSDAKRRRIARQTLDIYAPLAHRLGIQEIRWQLEDLAFATLHPRRYGEIEQMVAIRAPERASYLRLVLEQAGECLRELGIDAEVTGRPKHYWSIYEKMVVRGKEFDEIHDLVGIRVLVESEKDCWAALGAIHGLWSPVQGRFKDYINTPKFNLYQSLHTTVVGAQGKTLEVQVRTRDMHRRAEFGIAAHWGYKERSSPAEMAWLQRIVDWQSDTPDPVEFLETLKLDLELDEVYVFTPKGKVITLPVNATPVDFAYAIHTEVGHRCVGAKVNGRLVPIGSKLRSGDTVEIITSKVASAGPSRDWLSQVASPRARTKIRQWFSRERREDAIDSGRDELTKALRREGLPVQKLASASTLSSLAESLSYTDTDALYAAIGEGHLSARSVAQRLARELRGGEEAEQQQVPTTARSQSRPSGRRSPGVYVEGLDDLAVWLSRCCTPVPGDQIVGFVTRGRGVSVHRADCANAISLSEGTRERMIEVEWDRDSTGVFRAGIEVRALDRSRLLADVSRVLSEHHINITKSTTRTSSDRVCRMRFEFELANPGHLESVLGALRGLDSVYNAYRLVPGKGA